MDLLKGRIALVTGSSRGIGAAIAVLFAEEGASVALHGRDEAALASVLADARLRGKPVTAVTGDVTNAADIERMREHVERELGPVDTLVANAGASGGATGPLETVSDAAWRAVIEGNLTATFLTIKAFLPGMKRGRAGCIITISSAAARRPHANSPVAYAAAKAGIEMLTQDVAIQAAAGRSRGSPVPGLGKCGMDYRRCRRRRWRRGHGLVSVVPLDATLAWLSRRSTNRHGFST